MIIGLCGKKGSGKDTAAKYLVENYGYTRIGFADKLKESVAALFNIPLEKVDEWKADERNKIGIQAEWYDSSDRYPEPAWVPTAGASLTWREFLQRYGTESHRDVFGEDFWVDLILPYESKKERYLEVAKKKLVFSDTRFENEAARINVYGGLLVEIVRPSLADVTDSHRSEKMPFIPDLELMNLEDNMVNLYAALDEFMEVVVGDSN